MKLRSVKISINRTEAVMRKFKTPVPLKDDTDLHEIIHRHVDAIMKELIEQHGDEKAFTRAAR